MAKKRILLVDDEPDFLTLVRLRLEANGYDVETASDGAQALEKIQNSRPDAVLLDIKMPVCDGIEVLKKIRATDKKLPVYLLTAFSNTERFGSAATLGASGFMVKTGDLQGEISHITTSLNLADNYNGE